MKNKPELELRTIRLFKGDSDRLQEYYQKSGYNKAIRVLVRNHLNKLDKKLSEKLPEEEFNDE